MPTLNINHFFGDIDVKLPEDGSINGDVHDAFTLGHCHSFALALSAATGWAVAGVDWDTVDPCDVDIEVGFDEPVKLPNHVVCVDDNGQAWDITGPVHKTDIRVIDPDEARGAFYGAYREPEVEVAALYIPAWIKEFQGQHACV